MERSNRVPFPKVRRKTEGPTPKKRKESQIFAHSAGGGMMFHDEFNCRCSICRNFYRTLICGGKTPIYIYPPLCLPNEKTIRSFEQNWIKLGDRVFVLKHKCSGVVKYVGPITNDILLPETYVGIQLDEPIGTHAGIVAGKWYFEAPKGRGIMVKYREVRKIKPPEKRPPLKGNAMHPSYNPGHYRNFLARSSSEMSSRSGRSIHRRAQTAPPLRQKSSEKTTSPKFGMMIRKEVGVKDAKKRPKGQMSPQVIRHVNRWHEEYDQKQVDQMTATLRKLYIAKEKGKKELELEKEAEEAETKAVNRFTTLKEL